MKLVEFTIKNYKSLREVKVEFGDYTALIGKNGSGKTSILEALYLFFKDFNTVGGTPSPILQEATSWYDQNLPLEFMAKMVLDEGEWRDIFPKGLLSKIIAKYESTRNELTILRRIPRPGESWQTGYVRIGRLSLAKDNVMVPTEELTKAISKAAPKRPPDRLQAILFDPNAEQSNLIGERLIVFNDTAYPMDDYTDNLVREGKIPFEHRPGEDYKAWAANESLNLVENPPAKEDVDTFLSGGIPLTDDQALQHLQNKITDKIKGKLKLIPATRNERVGPGERAPFLNASSIVNPLASLHTTNFVTWYEIERAVEELTGQTLDSVPTLSAREENLRFAIHLIGGGQQEIIGLLHEVYTASESIIAIEEPETHLHHSLSRGLFRLLKKLAGGKQLIVATHSEYFAEISETSKNWFLEKKVKETKPKEIKAEKDLLKAFGSLGAEPRDRGYPNKILFVAGETEEGVLPVWAEKLGVDIKKIRVEALEGEYDKRKISIINDYIEEAQTTVFLMVDSHASNEVKQAVDKDHRLILKGTIEACYPIQILIYVLNENFGLKLTEADIDSERPRVEEIKKILHEKLGVPKTKTVWKRPIGKEVAERMSKDDIPTEVKDFIMKVAG